MIERLKKGFKEKKIENLVTFLIILIVTLLIINKILNNDTPTKEEKSNTVQLVTTENTKIEEENLEIKLENILAKIDGVGDVDVLITYSESSKINPLYNENTSISTTKDNSASDNSKITETQSISKEIITDNSSNPIIQTTSSPKIEGAIVTAKGGGNGTIKANIIAAIEAATGLASHKIQVFEMKK